MDINSDIIIVGGGLTGALAATALAHSGFSITLIDAEPPANRALADFDGRTTAIAAGAMRVIQNLGLWKDLAPNASPINTIQVTDGKTGTPFSKAQKSHNFLQFGSAEPQEDATPQGWVIENRHLLNILYNAVDDHADITVLAGQKVIDYIPGNSKVTITTDQGTGLTATLIIAADGQFSPLRAKAAIKTIDHDYHQTAIVCSILHSLPHDHIARQVFLPAGPFAILPLTANRSSIVWSEKPSLARLYMQQPAQEFEQELMIRMGTILGDISLSGGRWSFPLTFKLAEKYHAKRLVLVGDAAHKVHPIAGQGYNLAIKDIAVLVDILTQTRQTGLDIGYGTQLETYTKWRRSDTVTSAYSGLVLNKLFSNTNPILRQLRDSGMGMINNIDPLKDFLSKEAKGELGELPTLMQP